MAFSGIYAMILSQKLQIKNIDTLIIKVNNNVIIAQIMSGVLLFVFLNSVLDDVMSSEFSISHSQQLKHFLAQVRTSVKQ